MKHDIFISYATADKAIADAVTAGLESKKIRCWIAPRDICHGESYGKEIVHGIKNAKVLVLIFSQSSNNSGMVLKEVERAVSIGIPVIPFRIENTIPSEAMEFFIASTHWLDAITPKMETHITKLADTLDFILNKKKVTTRDILKETTPPQKQAEELQILNSKIQKNTSKLQLIFILFFMGILFITLYLNQERLFSKKENLSLNENINKSSLKDSDKNDLIINIENTSIVNYQYPLKACTQKTSYQIITGSKSGTYYRIAQDLNKYVAPDACINLKIRTSKGSLDNAFKLNSKEEKKIKFAIVQSDVMYQLFNLANNKHNKKAKKLVNNLRVLHILYEEEVHIFTKMNSRIQKFQDLRNKKINIDSYKSGSAMTGTLIYKDLFGENIKFPFYENFKDAREMLFNDKIDAIIRVAGQPIPILNENFTANTSKYLTLLSANAKALKKLSNYRSSTIKAKNYPWLTNNIQSVSTQAVLITYNYKKNTKEYDDIRRFVKSLKNNLPTLKKNASKETSTPHLKWKQVPSKCNLQLPSGWKYYNAIKDICNLKNEESPCTSMELLNLMCHE